MDGDEALIDHRSDYLTLLPLLSAQSSPPLEQLLPQILQNEQKEDRLMFRDDRLLLLLLDFESVSH